MNKWKFLFGQVTNYCEICHSKFKKKFYEKDQSRRRWIR